MIFFSVIIPAYNRATFITEAINSVLHQTYNHFEIIIVDDGSTDNTRDVIEKNYGTNDRVRYFYKQNEERGAARNFGLKQAKGEYAVFFDSDDWMLPGYLDILNKTIKAHPGIFLLAAKYNYNHNGREEIHPALASLNEGWYDRSFFLKGNILACNYCIRISDQSYNFFPEERELASMEDWLFLLINLEKEKIFIRNEMGVTMRQHDERSMQNNQKVIAARKNATAWILQKISLNDREQKTLKAWSHYFCGIHQYLDHKSQKAIVETRAAIQIVGINKKFLYLLLKSIIGRKFIARLK